MFSLDPFERGAIWNSRSNAARTISSVSILVEGLPVSIKEIVSWRNPIVANQDNRGRRQVLRTIIRYNPVIIQVDNRV